MTDNAIEIHNLSFAYDVRKQILRDISLTIPHGQVVALMGGSGSGKTTLLRNICGQVEADAGEVNVLGRSLRKISRRDLYFLRREVGILFQFGGLFTDMSVYDNVAFPLREHWDLSPSTIHDIVMLKLETVGLRGSAYFFPSELSGGMQRRMGLARAVATDPKLILYDEPFAGLDPISLAITAKLIQQINTALNATSVLVTHDIAETFRIADYAYLLWQGSLVGQGTPSELQNSPSPEVQQFLNAKSDGKLPFHQPAAPLARDLKLETAAEAAA